MRACFLDGTFRYGLERLKREVPLGRLVSADEDASWPGLRVQWSCHLSLITTLGLNAYVKVARGPAVSRIISHYMKHPMLRRTWVPRLNGPFQSGCPALSGVYRSRPSHTPRPKAADRPSGALSVVLGHNCKEV